jgi:hypothetical protein
MNRMMSGQLRFFQLSQLSVKKIAGNADQADDDIGGNRRGSR